MRRRNTKNKRSSNKGASLVEMLICFMLLSILMVSASQMIASAMQTYSNSKRGVEGREVADVIADHIEGVMEKAYLPDTDSEDKAIEIIDNKKAILTDNEKRKVIITVDANGYLDMIYGKYMDQHWRFDESLYRGYSITSMQFYYVNQSEYRPGTYKMVLKLNNPKTGTYEAVRYINCLDENK